MPFHAPQEHLRKHLDANLEQVNVERRVKEMHENNGVINRIETLLEDEKTLEILDRETKLGDEDIHIKSYNDRALCITMANAMARMAMYTKTHGYNHKGFGYSVQPVNNWIDSTRYNNPNFPQCNLLLHMKTFESIKKDEK